MPRTPTPRQMERRQRILRAAKNQFARFGFAVTDMAAVAASAGVGKGTLYTYFESKEKLYLTVIEGELDRAFAQVRGHIVDDKNPSIYLASFIDSLVDYWQENIAVIGILMQPDAPHREQIASIVQRAQDRHLPRHADVLRRGIETGVLTPMDEFFLVWLIHSCAMALVFDISGTGRYPPDELKRKMKEVFLAALTPVATEPLDV
jgi:AcrR family transcriptional regulator